jgi:hypothetical protein
VSGRCRRRGARHTLQAIGSAKYNDLVILGGLGLA